MADRVFSYEFRGKFNNLTAGLAAGGKSVQAFGTKLTALDKQGVKYRQGLTSLGNGAGKFGLVAAAGLGAIIATTARFDKAMSAVQAATHESASAMEDLRAAAIKAGADTSFSASEAAGAIEQLAKAGVSTADILSGGLSGALNLAAAGQLDVGQAAEIAATALTQFKLGGEDVNHIADLLAAGAGKAQGEVTDLGMALKQSGLVASQFGLSVDDTVGSLAAFAKAGLIGSDAGTSFKQLLLSLANPSKKASNAMEDLGIQAYDAQGKFVGITNLSGQLQEAFKGQTQATRDAALSTIFGSDAIRAANVLYTQGATGIQGWIDKTNDSGYAAETAGIQLDNLAGDFEQLKGSLETALIGAGEGSQGPLRNLVQGLTGAVNEFNKLPPAAQSSVTALLGITAVTGGTLWFGAKVVGGIADTREALQQLGVSAETSGRLLGGAAKAAGVAALAFAGLAVIDKLQVGSAKAVPGIQALTRDLGKLSDAGGNAELPKQFDDLSNSIDRLADPNRAQALQDSISDTIGFGGGSELKNSRAEIEALDGALSNLVATGGAAKAQAAFAQIGKSAGLSDGQISDLAKLLPNYTDALAGAENQADALSTATDDFGVSARQAATATEAEADALENATKAMRDKKNATLAAFDAETSYRQALKAAKAQADKSSAGIRGNSDEAIENRNQISALAAAWNNQSDAVKNNSGRFKAARQTFIDTAAAMGVPRDAARKLAKQLLEIPESRVTTIKADTGPATGALAAFQARLNALGDKTIHINAITNHPTAPLPGRADGGTIEGARYPYADKAIYALAPGEEVISNRFGQADRHRSLLKAINAGKRFADGGTAGRRYVQQGGSHGGGGTTIVVSPQSLKGLRLAGAVTINGLDGYIDSRIEDEFAANAEFDRDHRRGA